MRQVSKPSNQPAVHSKSGLAKGFRAVLATTLFVFAIVWSGKATATTIITVNTTSDFKTADLGATGTFFLNVYSQQYQSLNPFSPAIGPNATQSLTNVIGGVPGTGTPIAGASIIVSTGVAGQNQVQMMYGGNAKASERTVAYGPTIRVPPTINAKKQVVQPQKGSLTMPGDNVTITSTSGMYTAQAAAFQATPKGEIFASTSIDGTPPPAGQSAAQAIDPFTVPSGYLYSYDPTVTGSVELDSANVAGGFAEFAVDSSTFTSDTLDNFVDDGSPLEQTLWYLSVGANKPTTGASSVIVNFQLNPLALNEIMFSSSFLASLGPYSNSTSEALLIDNAIDQYLTSQLEPDNAAVELNDVSIFPVDTMFQAIDGGVEYANGVDAVVGSVPEPGSLAILAFGLVALAAKRNFISRFLVAQCYGQPRLVEGSGRSPAWASQGPSPEPHSGKVPPARHCSRTTADPKFIRGSRCTRPYRGIRFTMPLTDCKIARTPKPTTTIPRNTHATPTLPVSMSWPKACIVELPESPANTRYNPAPIASAPTRVTDARMDLYTGVAALITGPAIGVPQSGGFSP